jgi:hypothetical protein
MAQRVVFHIGLMKSGTTFIQGRLDTNRGRLAEQGILFPGPTWARHVRAVSDLRLGKNRKPGSWASLTEEIDEHPGTAIVSMEYLAPMGAARIAVLRRSFPDTEIRVAVTVRDLGRTVPAMWQEALKNRRTWQWPNYVKAIQSGGDPGRRFWMQQHSGRIVRRWAAALGAEKVYVVTVPPPGAPSETLWHRFGEVAGLGPGPWDEAPRANESLGAASTLVLRELNLATKDLTPTEYKMRVKALGKHVMGRRRGEEEPIGFVVPEWLHEESKKIRIQLERSGVHIVGDLDDLIPLDVPGIDPRQVSDGDQRDAAVAALAETLRQVRRIS